MPASVRRSPDGCRDRNQCAVHLCISPQTAFGDSMVELLADRSLHPAALEACYPRGSVNPRPDSISALDRDVVHGRVPCAGLTGDPDVRISLLSDW